MARYVVTTCDYAAPGMERLRSRDEFILGAFPSTREGWRGIGRQWESDLQSCDRPEGFDYAAARKCIRDFVEVKSRESRGRINPLQVSREDEESAPVLLYIRDNLASEES